MNFQRTIAVYSIHLCVYRFHSECHFSMQQNGGIPMKIHSKKKNARPQQEPQHGVKKRGTEERCVCTIQVLNQNRFEYLYTSWLKYCASFDVYVKNINKTNDTRAARTHTHMRGPYAVTFSTFRCVLLALA